MKDAKGHGSNSRGGSYPNIDKNLKGPGRHVGYSNGPWQISKLGAGYLATHSKTGESFRGDTLGHISRGLSDRDTSVREFLDHAAASELASGPKSAPVPTHDAHERQPTEIDDGMGGRYRPGVIISTKGR